MPVAASPSAASSGREPRNEIENAGAFQRWRKPL